MKVPYWKFSVPGDHTMNFKDNENKNEILDLAKELKKVTDHESDRDTYYDEWARNGIYDIYQPLRSGRMWHKINF